MTKPENLSGASLPFVILYRGRRVQSSHLRKAATIYMFPTHAHGVRLKSNGGTKLRFIIAHRTLIVRKLKGLEEVIPFTAVSWHMQARGWHFATPEDKEPGENVTPDPVEGHEKYTHLRVWICGPEKLI